MMTTSLRVHFIKYDSPLFTIHCCWDVPAGASYPLAAASAGVPDPDREGFILSRPAILFTLGRWRYENPEYGTGQTFGVGDGAFRHRRAGAYLVTALDEKNGKMCVEPKDGAIWRREAVLVPNQESILLGPWPEDRYLFNGRGQLLLPDGEEVLNRVPFRIASGLAIEMSCRAAAAALLLWKEQA